MLAQFTSLQLFNLSLLPGHKCSSWRIHARHRYKEQPILPKLRNGRVLQRNEKGEVEAFLKEKFFTHIDMAPGGQYLVLTCNMYFVYLVDGDCSVAMACFLWPAGALRKILKTT